MAKEAIHYVLVRNPETAQVLTFFTSNLRVHREVIKGFKDTEYQVVDTQEDFADITSFDEALKIAEHVMPLSPKVDT